MVKNNKIKTKEWDCTKEKTNKGESVFCVSKKGKLLSAFGDETVRFSSDKQVTIDGKVPKLLKGQQGVELE